MDPVLIEFLQPTQEELKEQSKRPLRNVPSHCSECGALIGFNTTQRLCVDCVDTSFSRQCHNCMDMLDVDEFTHPNSIICSRCYLRPYANDVDTEPYINLLSEIIYNDVRSACIEKHKSVVSAIDNSIEQLERKIERDIVASVESNECDTLIRLLDLKENTILYIAAVEAGEIINLEEDGGKELTQTEKIDFLQRELASISKQIGLISSGAYQQQMLDITALVEKKRSYNKQLTLLSLRTDSYNEIEELRKQCERLDITINGITADVKYKKQAASKTELNKQLDALEIKKSKIIKCHHIRLNKFTLPREQVDGFFDMINAGDKTREELLKSFANSLDMDIHIPQALHKLELILDDAKVCSGGLKDIERRIRKGEKLTISDIVQSADPFHTWVKAHVSVAKRNNAVDLTCKIKTKEVYTRYVADMESIDVVALSEKEFSGAFTNLMTPQGMVKVKSSGVMIYKGIKFITTDEVVEEEVEEE